MRDPVRQFLSPRDLADAVGVSESSLKRWADEGVINVFRTAGGHRRIHLREAIRFIRQQGLPVVNPQKLGLTDLGDRPLIESDQMPHAGRLGELLIAGRATDVRGLVLSMYLAGQSFADICDQHIAPAMHAIGELWQHDTGGIFIEHRAVDLCVQAVSQVRGLLPMAEDSAPVAIGGAPPRDPYMLPSLLVATVLAGAGWREMNLGPQTPVDVLTRAVDESGAALVWLSISVEESAEAVARQLPQLSRHMTERHGHVVIGGRACTGKLRTIDGVHVAQSMTELAAFVKGLRAAAGASAAVFPSMHQ